MRKKKKNKIYGLFKDIVLFVKAMLEELIKFSFTLIVLLSFIYITMQSQYIIDYKKFGVFNSMFVLVTFVLLVIDTIFDKAIEKWGIYDK